MYEGVDFKMLFLLVIVVLLTIGGWFLYNNMNVVKSKIRNIDKVISVLVTPHQGSDEVVHAATDVLPTVEEGDENVVEE